MDELACAEFIGAFIGDGFFIRIRQRLYVGFTGDSILDRDYYEKVIIPLAYRLVDNPRPHIYPLKGKRAIRIAFYSQELAALLLEKGFRPGPKAHTVTIPSEYLQRELVGRVIRGLFDTDGGVYVDCRSQYVTAYPRIVFQTASRNLHEQLVSYLSLSFSLYAKQNARGFYVLEIYGREQLAAWLTSIGFSNQRHLNKVSSSSAISLRGAAVAQFIGNE